MKRTFIILVTLVSNILLSQNIDDNLLVHYPFSNNANDTSGNHFDGLPNATLIIDRFGNTNEAYSFNGIEEYVDFPNVPELKPQLPVSFSFWVKFDDLNPENTVIFTTDFAQNNHSGVWMNLSSTGSISITYGDATGNTTSTNRRSKIGTTPININEWYHIAGVVKGPTDMELYVNCSNDDGSYFGSGDNLSYTSNPGSIGRKDGHTSRPAYYFKGALDEFKYWNRALTVTDINILCKNSALNVVSSKPIQENTIIYPNPTNGFIQIKANTIYKSTSIYNSIGELVYQKPYTTFIDVKKLNPGIYFLHLNNDSKQKIIPLIIKN